MSINRTEIGLFAKALGGAVTAALTAAITALSDGHIDTAEWITVASAFVAGLYFVWQVPEFPVSVAKYFKAATSGVIAGLASLAAVLVNGQPFTNQDWIHIAIAVLVSSGLVHVTKNATESQTMMSLPAAEPVAAVSSDYPLPTDPASLPVDDDHVVEDEDDSLVPVIAEEDDFKAPVETK